jgi:surface polysaccharide O-acyltransferase-like enzyme
MSYCQVYSALVRSESSNIMPREQVSGRSGGAPPLPAEAPAVGSPQAVLPHDQLHDQRTPRLVPIDNLKAVLVAWVIAGHAFLGYAAMGGWPYDEVAETTLPRTLELLLETVIGPTALFVIGTFFFLSGLLAPHSLAQHGPGGFVRQRLLRLGLPWLLFTLLIWPLVMWAAYRAAGRPLPIWQALQARQPFLDSGPLWFVQILLYVSLAHALLSWIVHRHNIHPRVALTLVTAALAIAAASFIIRLWFPARSQQVLDLHVWQWPQCIGLYVLGVLFASENWAQHVPRRAARRGGIAVLLAIALGVGVMAILGVSDFKRYDGPFLGGWHWQALALDVVEATLVVGGSVWLLAWAQRWLTSRAVRLTRVARSAYLAYLLQVPVLISLEIAGRSVPWPAAVKAVVVAAFAVAGSFGIAWFLTHRARGDRSE